MRKDVKVYWGNVTKCRYYGDEITLGELIRMLYAHVIKNGDECPSANVTDVTDRSHGARYTVGASERR